MSGSRPTAANIIFNRRFVCQIQYMYTLSNSDMNIFGISASGDRNIDDALMKDWVAMQLTIAEMVEYHSRGVPIILTNPPDSIEIYEVVKEHLGAWEQHVKTSYNMGNVPIDDLRKMDEFAAKVFPMACTYKKPEELRISKGIQDMLSRGPKAFKVSNANDISALQIKQPEQVAHTPVANIIAREFGNKTNTR